MSIKEAHALLTAPGAPCEMEEVVIRGIPTRVWKNVPPTLRDTLVAARAYRLDIIDGVYNDFRDEKGLREECERGRTLGMDGKTLIHPSQVAPCNEIFSPTEEEVEWSRKVIDAFGRPENEKKGVIVVEGRMVERLHFVMAQRTVTIAEQIREMEAASLQAEPRRAATL